MTLGVGLNDYGTGWILLHTMGTLLGIGWMRQTMVGMLLSKVGPPDGKQKQFAALTGQGTCVV